MQQSVRNVCAKFKVDRLSRFRTEARQVLTTKKPFYKRDNCNIKFPLTNTFPNQTTICQILFEIICLKSIHLWRQHKSMLEQKQ